MDLFNFLNLFGFARDLVVRGHLGVELFALGYRARASQTIVCGVGVGHAGGEENRRAPNLVVRGDLGVELFALGVQVHRRVLVHLFGVCG